jgi:hypothetical protein
MIEPSNPWALGAANALAANVRGLSSEAGTAFAASLIAISSGLNHTKIGRRPL